MAWDLIRACHKAPEEFRLLANDLITAQGHFRLLQEIVEDPSSLLNHRAD